MEHLMHTTELHGATYSDCMPAGEIRCLVIDGQDVAHYMLKQESSTSTRVKAWPVRRTDEGSGTTWYDAGQMFTFAGEEEAAQYMADRHRGVTRIGRDDGTVERYLHGERLEDARA